MVHQTENFGAMLNEEFAFKLDIARWILVMNAMTGRAYSPDVRVRALEAAIAPEFRSNVSFSLRRMRAPDPEQTLTATTISVR